MLVGRTVWPSTHALSPNEKLDESQAICRLQARGWERVQDDTVITADKKGQGASTQQENPSTTPARVVSNAGTSHNLTPEAEAELDRLLFPPNLPTTPLSPTPDPEALLPDFSSPATLASSTPFAPAEVAKALEDLTAENLQELLNILTAPAAPSPPMNSLKRYPGSASQLLPPAQQNPFSPQSAMSLESLEDWLLDTESLSTPIATPAQAQVQGPLTEVPCCQPQDPARPSCLTPSVTPRSQVASLNSCLSLLARVLCWVCVSACTSASVWSNGRHVITHAASSTSSSVIDATYVVQAPSTTCSQHCNISSVCNLADQSRAP